MRWFRADLHIHSVLSPCGDLDMSPARIIHEAKKKKLDIIGITDHNTTGHAQVMIEIGKKEGITVFPGVEICTKEEIHCLAFFESIEKTKQFQEYIDLYLPDVKNRPDKFGEQLLVNEKEEILEEIEILLINCIKQNVNEVEREVHNLDGTFIPAHINRQSNGIISQLGFIPDDLNTDALELTDLKQEKNLVHSKNIPLIVNSDAHIPEKIGSIYTSYYMYEPSFIEWKLALKQNGNRKIRVE